MAELNEAESTKDAKKTKKEKKMEEKAAKKAAKKAKKNHEADKPDAEYVKKDRFRCWIISVMCCFVFYHTYSILPVRCYACIQPFNSTHHSF